MFVGKYLAKNGANIEAKCPQMEAKRDTERERHRERERDTERETERERERETERESFSSNARAVC
jgi:hypothetical protein